MLRNQIIRTAGGILLLLTFTLSITPKNVLHHFFAHHQDSSFDWKRQTDQLTKAGYHCDCESQVVAVPYLDLPSYFPPEVSQRDLPSLSPAKRADQIFPISHFIFGLRGPPAHSALM